MDLELFIRQSVLVRNDFVSDKLSKLLYPSHLVFNMKCYDVNFNEKFEENEGCLLNCDIIVGTFESSFRYNRFFSFLACGGSLSGTSGTFTTPDYPRVYPRGRVCTWIITARASHSVQLRFTAFDLQAGSPCTNSVCMKILRIEVENPCCVVWHPPLPSNPPSLLNFLYQFLSLLCCRSDIE